jgi:hypothetical protein
MSQLVIDVSYQLIRCGVPSYRGERVWCVEIAGTLEFDDALFTNLPQFVRRG